MTPLKKPFLLLLLLSSLALVYILVRVPSLFLLSLFLLVLFFLLLLLGQLQCFFLLGGDNRLAAPIFNPINVFLCGKNTWFC